MRLIHWIRLVLELVVTALLLWIFPFNFERKVKLFLLYLFTMLIAGRYRSKTLLFYDELKLIVIGFFGFAFCACLTVAFRSATAGQEVGLILLFTLIDGAITILINRMVHVKLFQRIRRKTVILGTGKTARKLHNVIQANRFSAMDVVAFVNCNDDPFFENVNQEIVDQDAPVIPFSKLDSLLKEDNIDTVLIAIPEISHADLTRLNERLFREVENVKFLPYTQDLVNYGSTIDDFDGILMISTSQGKINPLEKAAKRAIDIVGATVGLPIVGIISAFVWVYSRAKGEKGPIFFAQKRIGKGGREFVCYKFRTMREGAEAELQKMLDEDPELAREYRINKKLQNDPRITAPGHMLRKTSMDELPQLFNVFKGEMSLIGPRPYLLDEKEDMGDYYDSIVAFAPGLTGMWQTHGRSRVSFDQRLQLDEFYYHNWTFWLDFTILMKTVQIILSGDKGAV